MEVHKYAKCWSCKWRLTSICPVERVNELVLGSRVPPTAGQQQGVGVDLLHRVAVHFSRQLVGGVNAGGKKKVIDGHTCNGSGEVDPLLRKIILTKGRAIVDKDVVQLIGPVVTARDEKFLCGQTLVQGGHGSPFPGGNNYKANATHPYLDFAS